MKRTLVLKVDSQEMEAESIRIAADLIKKGGLVAFPTETVYGLGADAMNADAVLALFEAKKRPFDNPPIVHVCSMDDVHLLARTVTPLAEGLAKRFWPGPLTLIFPRSETVPDVTVAGLDTIAVRMPNHPVALGLIRESRCPIAAPSANLAGRPSSTSTRHVLEDLGGRIDAVLDAGATQVGVESTVLDLTVDPPQVLRPGGTSFEELEKALGRVELNPAALADKAAEIARARSPGVKHRHYAPGAEMVVVEGEADSVVDRVKEIVKSQMAKGRKIAVLCSDETVNRHGAWVVRSLGSRSDLAEVASNLFRLLREVDSEGVDLIVAEGFPTSGLGLAIMNRLRKASGYNIVKATPK